MTSTENTKNDIESKVETFLTHVKKGWIGSGDAALDMLSDLDVEGHKYAILEFYDVFPTMIENDVWNAQETVLRAVDALNDRYEDHKSGAHVKIMHDLIEGAMQNLPAIARKSAGCAAAMVNMMLPKLEENHHFHIVNGVENMVGHVSDPFPGVDISESEKIIKTMIFNMMETAGLKYHDVVIEIAIAALPDMIKGNATEGADLFLGVLDRTDDDDLYYTEDFIIGSAPALVHLQGHGGLIDRVSDVIHDAAVKSKIEELDEKYGGYLCSAFAVSASLGSDCKSHALIIMDPKGVSDPLIMEGMICGTAAEFKKAVDQRSDADGKDQKHYKAVFDLADTLKNWQV